MRVYKGNRAALCYKIKKNNMNLKRTRSSCSRERERRGETVSECFTDTTAQVPLEYNKYTTGTLF